MNIQEYISEHTIRGECQCGQCIDKGNAPDPVGHTVDMIMFKVAATNNPVKDDFVRITKETHGEFADIDPFDGKEHGYIEIGAWIGSQSLALQYMALGKLLGAFNLTTPKELGVPDDICMQVARSGFLFVAAKKE